MFILRLIPLKFRTEIRAIVIAASSACFVAVVPNIAVGENIAAVVNDRIVTYYDVQERTKIVIRSTNITDTQQNRQRLGTQILRKLVDETLQIEEAERRNIAVSENDLQAAFEQIERQAQIAPGSLESFLSAQDIDFTVFTEKTRAEVAWAKLVNIRLRPQVQISDEEIKDSLELLKSNAGKVEYRISEIFLQVDQPSERDKITQQALRLQQRISDQRNFAAAAQQFSSGVTAVQGGNVGWVQPGQMDLEIDRELANIAVGTASAPIATTDGVYLIFMHAQRKILSSDPLETSVTLKQIILPLDGSNNDKNRAVATKISSEPSGCANLEPIAKNNGVSDFGELGTLRYRELPENIRAALRATKVGEFTKPIPQESQILILAICARNEPKSELPDELAIRKRITQARLGRLADRYLRDLRQAAIVEFRR